MAKNNDDFSDKQIARLQSLFVASEDRLKTEMKDYVYASEQRIKTELRGDMNSMEQRILHSIADHTDNAISPRLEDHDKRITWLEQKVRPV